MATSILRITDRYHQKVYIAMKVYQKMLILESRCLPTDQSSVSRLRLFRAIQYFSDQENGLCYIACALWHKVVDVWGCLWNTLSPFKSAWDNDSVCGVKTLIPCGVPLLKREQRDEEVTLYLWKAHSESGSTVVIFFNFSPHKNLVKVRKSNDLARCSWSSLEKFWDEYMRPARWLCRNQYKYMNKYN